MKTSPTGEDISREILSIKALRALVAGCSEPDTTTIQKILIVTDAIIDRLERLDTAIDVLEQRINYVNSKASE